MNCAAAGYILLLSGCGGREMRCIIGGQMAVSMHFARRAHCIASMEAVEMSEPVVSADALRQACVLIDAEVAGLEELSFG
jgi:hypothetical protein